MCKQHSNIQLKSKRKVSEEQKQGQNQKNVEITETEITVSIMLPYGGSEMQPLHSSKTRSAHIEYQQQSFSLDKH